MAVWGDKTPPPSPPAYLPSAQRGPTAVDGPPQARRRERLACSVYGRLELHAALHRKLREDDLTERQLEVVLRQLRMDEQARLWTWLPLTPAVMTAVSEAFMSLPRHVFLRAGDAVHLLTAREHGLAEVYSSDRRLLAAAPVLGVAGRNVLAGT